PMIAKLIVAGADRAAAIDRLRRALDDYAVLGLTTNLPLLRAITTNAAFCAGDTHTGFLGEQQIHAAPPSTVPGEVLAAAAIWVLGEPAKVKPSPFESHWRAGGIATPLSFNFGKETHCLRARQVGKRWRIGYADGEIAVEVVAQRASELALSFGASGCERFRVARDTAGDLLLSWRGDAYRLSRPAPLSADSVGRVGHGHDGASLTAPMPGTLVKVLIGVGESVTEGQPLLVLEAMKMEHTVVAPYAGTVRRIPFSAGSSVAGGADLIELEAQEEG
ncbi:MAG: 3-methylcrotonyl-CoA carboxylase, partial [Oscillochloris sp.]|nr:3-methylcrotonyl-CoA carboxylase [Oscillochloris sp.]